MLMCDHYPHPQHYRMVKDSTGILSFQIRCNDEWMQYTVELHPSCAYQGEPSIHSAVFRRATNRSQLHILVDASWALQLTRMHYGAKNHGKRNVHFKITQGTANHAAPVWPAQLSRRAAGTAEPNPPTPDIPPCRLDVETAPGQHLRHYVHHNHSPLGHLLAARRIFTLTPLHSPGASYTLSCMHEQHAIHHRSVHWHHISFPRLPRQPRQPLFLQLIRAAQRRACEWRCAATNNRPSTKTCPNTRLPEPDCVRETFSRQHEFHALPGLHSPSSTSQHATLAPTSSSITDPL